MSSSGSQTSSRPPAKPKVLNPIDSSATLPARIIRSAHEIFRPYFCLIGQSSRRALSRLTLSGQLLSGAKRCVPAPAPPRPSRDTVGARAVPRHPDEQRPVVAVVGRPPVLRVRHQRMEVLDHGIQVETLEFLGVVECLAHRIGQRRVLVEDLQVQLIRPPVSIDPGKNSLMSSSVLPSPRHRACFSSSFVLPYFYFSPSAVIPSFEAVFYPFRPSAAWLVVRDGSLRCVLLEEFASVPAGRFGTISKGIDLRRAAQRRELPEAVFSFDESVRLRHLDITDLFALRAHDVVMRLRVTIVTRALMQGGHPARLADFTDCWRMRSTVASEI